MRCGCPRHRRAGRAGRPRTRRRRRGPTAAGRPRSSRASSVDPVRSSYVPRMPGSSPASSQTSRSGGASRQVSQSTSTTPRVGHEGVAPVRLTVGHDEPGRVRATDQSLVPVEQGAERSAAVDDEPPRLLRERAVAPRRPGIVEQGPQVGHERTAQVVGAGGRHGIRASCAGPRGGRAPQRGGRGPRRVPSRRRARPPAGTPRARTPRRARRPPARLPPRRERRPSPGRARAGPTAVVSAARNRANGAASGSLGGEPGGCAGRRRWRTTGIRQRS